MFDEICYVNYVFTAGTGTFRQGIFIWKTFKKRLLNTFEKSCNEGSYIVKEKTNLIVGNNKLTKSPPNSLSFYQARAKRGLFTN